MADRGGDFSLLHSSSISHTTSLFTFFVSHLLAYWCVFVCFFLLPSGRPKFRGSNRRPSVFNRLGGGPMRARDERTRDDDSVFTRMSGRGSAGHTSWHKVTVSIQCLHLDRLCRSSAVKLLNNSIIGRFCVIYLQALDSSLSYECE